MIPEPRGPLGGRASPGGDRLLAAIESNLIRVREKIAAAAERTGRSPGDVTMLAITKSVGPAEVRASHALGLRDFGESTVQGLSSKLEALADLPDARWHLVGHLQSNKVPRAIALARSIHSIDSERLLREILAQASRRGLPVPELYVEVNVAEEPRKTGLGQTDLRPLLRLARELALPPGGGMASPATGVPLPIAGLMAMAPLSHSAEAARACFRSLRELLDGCVREGLLPAGAGLSMGMSGDFVVAVEEGATVVRVGSALFEGIDGPPST